MRRLQLFEFHDRPWFPGTWRDVITDLLRVFSIHANPYRPVYPLLLDALRQSQATGILDLCSGGSGPWEDLKGWLQQSGLDLPVLLTDKYPHQRAVQQTWWPGCTWLPRGGARGDATYAWHQRVRSARAVPPRSCQTWNQAGIRYLEEPVDAVAVPAHLAGFRTLFASFHHFRPAEAQRILQGAVTAGSGIAIMEFTGWTWRWFLASIISPCFFWVASPFLLRPFTWRHLVWIYLLPIPLLCTVWDSLVSGSRTYSLGELAAMVHFPGAEAYQWQVGECTSQSTRACKVTYLIGLPQSKTAQPR